MRIALQVSGNRQGSALGFGGPIGRKVDAGGWGGPRGMEPGAQPRP
jgi:hypothetical protein